MKIPFYKPDISEADATAVADVVRSGRLTTGEQVKQLEAEFADYVGARYCIAVDSLTSGLLLLLDLLNPKEYNLPSGTYVSMAAIPRKFGIPVTFTDNWTVGKAYPILTDRGVIYDSAHEISKDICKRDSDAYWLFSLHATKIITAGCGGIIALNSEQQYNFLRTARDSHRLRSPNGFDYVIPMVGWNQEFSDIHAALGRSQLSRVEEILEKRRAVSQKLADKITPHQWDMRSDYLYQVYVDKPEVFIRKMKELEIGISRHFFPLHLQPAYENKKSLPTTETLGTHLISIPFFPDMSDEEVEIVSQAINQWRT